MSKIATRTYLCCLVAIAGCCFAATLRAQSDLDQLISKETGSLTEIYKHIHQNPELSTQEKQTSELLAGELRRLGFEVTEKVGKYDSPDLVSYGVVGVLRNGTGPTVLVRTELDALPVEERTNLPYASHVKVKRADAEVGVMHACGHDLHMTSWIGTARMLVQLKNQWHGTLLMIGQPAEEAVGGAKAMLNDGLYTRFPRPDYVLALHDNPTVAAGKVAWKEGPLLAGSDAIDITVRGYGGHGAAPHMTKDPIVIASEIVVMLQTIVSREVDPLDSVVVTVGSFHAGTKNNVIPDEALLQLTVRTIKPEVREKVLASIKRITEGVASAAGVPAERAPIIKVLRSNPPTVNNPELARRVGAALERALGKDNVLPADPIMASEDFNEFGLTDPHPPYVMFWLGATDPARLEDARTNGTRLPSLHSSEFYPQAEPAIRTGVKAMTASVLALLQK
ncbi:MAG: amidohydrolase [Acidobacteriota bacterium]|nr:amidohydrolase [Acidobacteriota bacterium]